MIRKLFKAFIFRICSLIHCSTVKFFHPKAFYFCLEEMITVSTHFVIRDNGKITLGKRCGMRRACEVSVAENGVITIGNDVFFNKGCVIAAHNNIVIGDATRFGPNVMVYDHDYDYKNLESQKRSQHICSPVIIGNNVWLGAGVTILRGSVIGDNCVIGAGCVIKGNYPANSIVVQKRDEFVQTIQRRREET